MHQLRSQRRSDRSHVRCKT